MEEGDIVTFSLGKADFENIEYGYDGPNDAWRFTITSDMKRFAMNLFSVEDEPRLEIARAILCPDGSISSVILSPGRGIWLWPPEILKLVSARKKKKRVKLSF